MIFSYLCTVIMKDAGMHDYLRALMVARFSFNGVSNNA